MQVTMTMEEYEDLKYNKNKMVDEINEQHSMEIMSIKNTLMIEVMKLKDENNGYKREMEKICGRACEFCAGEKTIYLNQGLEITLAGSRLDLYYEACGCDRFEDELKIKYCPFCGKEL